jgi:anaphase-promoting complex subunit 3
MRTQLSTSANMATPTEGPLQTNPNGLNLPNTPGAYDPFNPSRSAVDPGLNHGGPNFMSRLNGNIPSFPAQGQSLSADWDTPVTNGTLYEEDAMMSDSQIPHDGGAPPAPLRKKGTITSFVSDMMTDAPKMRPMAGRYRKIAAESSGDAEPVRVSSIPVNHKRTVSGHAPPGTSSSSVDSQSQGVRRSARIKDHPTKPSSSTRLASVFNRNADSREKRELPKAKATGTKGRGQSTAGRAVSGNSRPPPPGDKEVKDSRPASSASSVREALASRKQIAPFVEPSNQELEALQWLLSLCAKLGEGYYELSRYRCLQALQILESITISQKETPWVLAQIGRAHYERSSYVKAAEVFARMRKIAPSRTENMEVYSTVLWHLKEDLDLAYLSHELLDIDRLSPEAWCAIGNSFSLQREHDQAIKCFKRATQLDPKFAYAFTLQGHEHVANEEYDKAVHAYRCAISADNRHYNGWYGLGQVYEKLGQWDIAEKHYRSASQINQTNPVLCVCIGLILEKLKKSPAALVQYGKAVDLDPKSAKARFMKARVLMKLRRPKEACTELEILKNIAPDESMVHFMLGRLSKMMGDKTAAIKHLTIAMNLDPKVCCFSLPFVTFSNFSQAAPHIKDALESLEEEDDDFDEEDMV